MSRCLQIVLLPLVVFMSLFAPDAIGGDLAPEQITLNGDLGPFQQKITASTPEPGVKLFTLKLTADEPATLKPLELKFDFPSIDINGYWSSRQTLDRVNYYRTGFTSGASGAAPLLAFYNNRLQNRITIAMSETLNPIEFSTYMKEEDVRFYATLKLFTVRMPPVKEYEVTLRIDTRPVRYNTAIDDTRRWWESAPGYESAPVPDDARRPMYSTWYSYHQLLDADELVAECKVASELGCGAIIVDDGWQTLDSNRGYAFTGDWHPERLTDMRSFVDRVHATNMKVLLWYSLPFMGEQATRFEEFQGKYLHHFKSQRAWVLDPRYPEVRQYMIDTYEQAMRDWDLDGFKLDFIGWFKTYNDTKLTAADGRDFASVARATDHLMTEITRRLRAINPDVMIEFRQPYVGPVMRKYGNLFRGVDCPNNAAANRNEIANLRILSGDTAVHSDMFIWRNEEPTHVAALQLLNILFSVPQVSVKLEAIPAEHRVMLEHWLAYWNANRQVLLDGDFYPGNPGANYPSLTSIKEGKQITALYETPLARQQKAGVKSIDLINATGGEVIYLDLSEEWGECKMTITNAQGETVSEKRISLPAGVHRFETPRSGMLTLRVPSDKQ